MKKKYDMGIFDNLLDKIEKDNCNLSNNEQYKIFQRANELINRKRKQERDEKIKLENDKIALEINKKLIDDVAFMELPLDYENSFANSYLAEGVHSKSIQEAYLLSIHNLGHVDIEYIAFISNSQHKNVIKALKGFIYQNPEKWEECFYKGFETAEEYLSGNIMRKYHIAIYENQKYNGYFEDNILAIKNILPSCCPYDEIYITLGSPWVPPDIIYDFIKHLFHSDTRHYNHVNYEPITGSWEIEYKRGYDSVLINKTFGTERMNALTILEKTLNMQNISITDEVASDINVSGKKKIINHSETIAALEKQQKIIAAFKNWIWLDEKRKERLVNIYEYNFGCTVKRHFDGSHLTFPNMSKEVNLRAYQKNAVAKILFTSNVLLAHEVGAGKTFIMIAAGMELKRIGLSKKNMYVVPNNILEQWKNMFLKLYPNANILYVTPSQFTPNKREFVLKQIKDENFDAIIISYSSFELIPLSKKYLQGVLNNEIEFITKALNSREVKDIRGKLFTRREKLKEKIQLVENVKMKDSPKVYFDELNINTLFVDEAHNYKNLPIESKIDNILGLNKNGSDKCTNLLNKVRCIQQNNNGRGIVFATGTPITNSITDVFVMQTYLQYKEISFLNLHLFDNWAGMFAEKTNEFEIDPTSSSYRIATRFAKFHNIPELTSLLSQIADFIYCEKEEIPVFKGYTDSIIPKTTELDEYIKLLAERAEDIRTGVVNRKIDNMLMITTEGRKAALDIRLVNDNTINSITCKANYCAERAALIYFKTAKAKLTQIIFCDTSVPQINFNMYDEIKKILLSFNVLENEIAFIHDFNTESKRDKLFTKIQNGEIRILLGSTFKLGIGVNVQKKLIAIHHLDIPWRPADMVQREGRILRQGNENDEINIYRYITEGSFDAYSWQMLETKQRFIADLLGGFNNERSIGDVDNTVLNYAEVKALAIGNPLIKTRVEKNNELMKFNALQKNISSVNNSLCSELNNLPQVIEYVENIIINAKKDNSNYQNTKLSTKEISNRNELRKNLFDAVADNILRYQEMLFGFYQGFKIILPSNMLANKPYIILEGNARYEVELGETEVGNLIRIDNRLDTLNEFIEKHENRLYNLYLRKKDIENELNKNESYTERILKLKKEIKALDKKLGVENS